MSGTTMKARYTKPGTTPPMWRERNLWLLIGLTCTAIVTRATAAQDSGSPSPSISPSPSVSASITSSATWSPSETPSITASASWTPSLSGSPSETPSITASASWTPSVSGTPAETPSVTPSWSETPSVTLTPSGTPSQTLTSSASSSKTQTPSVTTSSTGTPSRTSTSSVTATPSSSSTVTPTTSVTPSETATPSVTASVTASRTASSSVTASNTGTPTPTRTETRTPSNTPTGTASVTPTPTTTPSNTGTGTRTPSVTPTTTRTPSQTSTPSGTPSVSPSFSSRPSTIPVSRRRVTRSRLQEADICSPDQGLNLGENKGISSVFGVPSFSNSRLLIEGYPQSEGGKGSFLLTPVETVADCQDDQIRITCSACSDQLQFGESVKTLKMEENQLLMFATGKGPAGEMLAVSLHYTDETVDAQPVNIFNSGEKQACELSNELGPFISETDNDHILVGFSMDCDNQEMIAYFGEFSSNEWVDQQESATSLHIRRSFSISNPIFATSPDQRFVLSLSKDTASSGTSSAFLCGHSGQFICFPFRLYFPAMKRIDGVAWISSQFIAIYGVLDNLEEENAAVFSELLGLPASVEDLHDSALRSVSTGIALRLRENGLPLRNYRFFGIGLQSGTGTSRLRRDLNAEERFSLVLHGEDEDDSERNLEHEFEDLVKEEDADSQDDGTLFGSSDSSGSRGAGVGASVAVVLAITLSTAVYVLKKSSSKGKQTPGQTSEWTIKTRRGVRVPRATPRNSPRPSLSRPPLQIPKGEGGKNMRERSPSQESGGSHRYMKPTTPRSKKSPSSRRAPPDDDASYVDNPYHQNRQKR
eukprot:gb/GECG01004485.1/.p1 GENE.gb/GECG01004485.1/~~gb/GECG01004485.1/.p1  ORF type:complete len:819 (+),score=103.82 gb/GECG01004485.1/:1-2457(+)